MFDSLALRQAYQRMCQSVPGGHGGMAHCLGISEGSLAQRIGEHKGMAVTVRQAFDMQEAAERTDFAEAVAMMSGGIFIPLPDAEIIEEDIKDQLLLLAEEVGRFYSEHREALDDGVLTKSEKRRLDAAAARISQYAAASILLAVKYGTRNGEPEAD